MPNGKNILGIANNKKYEGATQKFAEARDLPT